MNYRRLGKAAIQVSELSLGPWLTFSKHLSVKATRELVALAYDRGINLFDNAERYAEGMAECLMGEVLKCFRRESLVVTTKLFWGGFGPNDIGLSRKHLLEGMKNSLRRLQLDYVDLVFCHRPDPYTSLEETVLAMDSIVRQGYAFYWGTSQWPAEKIVFAYQLAQQMHCIPPSMEQAEYNLFQRQRVEQEYRNLYQTYTMGVIAHSPLASGVLTGKYSDGIPVDSRLASESRLITSDFNQRVKKVKRMKIIADALRCSVAQLALAWCLSNARVSSVLIGASNKEQLIENLGAVSLQSRITQDIKMQLDVLFLAESTQV